jgi:adenylate cyclase
MLARVRERTMWRRREWQRLPGWVRRIVDVGALPSDTDEVRVRKAVVMLCALIPGTLAFVWIGTYAALGLWLSAAIPFAYQLGAGVGIFAFARTGRFVVFQRGLLWSMLLLPFLLQWSLGGFTTGSAAGAWAFVSPLAALLLVGPRRATPWFIGFAVLVAVSAAIDPALSARAPDVPTAVVLVFFALNILGVSTTSYLLMQYFVRERERALTELDREHAALEVEQAKSERLLLNVLPEPVANRLKESEAVIADAFPGVTVLFADIVGFTPLAEGLAPDEVVRLLDRVFARWDALAARHGLEKIKTIGDEYMVAGGIPLPREDHAEAIAEMALEMRSELAHPSSDGVPALEARIGIDSGPVVAGVIGRAKFSYDLWGDTVNTASRMESHGLPGEIQVTERAFERLREHYEFRLRGEIEVKGKGLMTTYLLAGRRDRAGFSSPGRSGVAADRSG